MDETSRKKRAAERRARMTVRKVPFGSPEDAVPIEGEPAISLAHRLTLESWSLARGDWPSYDRSRIPVRFVPGYGE